MSSKHILLTVAALVLAVMPLHSQKRGKNKNSASESALTEDYFSNLEWRNIGPFRGGRSTAVCGVVQDPLTYYMGSTGGGVWKTEDGGNTWNNISDGYFNTGSVGAVAVAPSDPNVIYAGTGEAPIRGVMTSSGDGVYRSTDAGKTWTHLGLENTRHISKIRIHPDNPDVAYVAAQGSPWQPNEERGVYRTLDGGKSWEKVLFVNESSGVSDLSIDLTNPRILYAAFWDHQRLPWKIRSGGEGSGIYKSTDGGDTWKELTSGLPKAIMGKIGVSVSMADPDRVWAIIESDEGGLYRSDDGGANWKLVNPDRVLRARSWYYMHVFAHPTDENEVYVLNSPVMHSIDGGKSFTRVATPHGDNHDLWINPENPQHMINANDGGANISADGGKTWSTQKNQPTAQFYRVNVDNQFPYRVYGGQQDNSTVSIPSQTDNNGIGWKDFYSVGGCESAFTGFDPNNPQYIYAGCYQGIITEYNADLNTTKDVMAYPYLGLGTKPSDVKYRFNWNAPILVSAHDPEVIFHAGNKVLKSTNRGIDWEEISPDLTLNDTSKLGAGGGPITNEGAGGEVYHTIAYLEEGAEGVLYAGTDDGLIHVTRNGGQSWANVTPSGIGEALVNAIEVSPHDPATAYAAVTRYKFNDFTPHIFKTTNYGESWERMVNGIGAEDFVRVVREDPNRKGLLYAGTERGMYISFNGGEQWQQFQSNLPIVPITDLIVHNKDLVAATQGRAFWILDDLSTLHQASEATAAKSMHLFEPRDLVKADGTRDTTVVYEGMNPHKGAVINYSLAEVNEEDSLVLTMDILDESGQVLRTYSSDAEEQADQLPLTAGMNTKVWDLRRMSYEKIPKLMMFGGGSSYRVLPGEYTVLLSMGEETLEQQFSIMPDPRINASPADYQVKARVLDNLHNSIDALYASVKQLQQVRRQVKDITEREDNADKEELLAMGERILGRVNDLESRLVQVKQKTFQDVINFPNQLDANLLHIQGLIDGAYPPLTGGQMQRYNDLKEMWQAEKAEIDNLLQKDVPEFNNIIMQNRVPYIAVDEAEDR